MPKPSRRTAALRERVDPDRLYSPEEAVALVKETASANFDETVELHLRTGLDAAEASVIDQTGGMGCLILAGPRRDEVMERSSAMDLRRDRVGDFAVIQTTVHVVPVVLYRAPQYDMLLATRDYIEFLFDALMDVGRGVGLRPGGLASLEVDFGGVAP